MSLDVYLTAHRPIEVYSRNITHNLSKMAEAAGIYMHLWRPEEIGAYKASELIAPLTVGLRELQNNPSLYRAYTPENGWGSYDGLIDFVREYLHACIDNPDADIKVSR